MLIELFQAEQAHDQTMDGAIHARFAYRIACYQIGMSTALKLSVTTPVAVTDAPAH